MFRANSNDTLTCPPIPLCMSMYELAGVLDSCTFEDNVGIATPTLTVARSELQVENCIFRRNRTTEWGAIVSLVQECTVDFRGCLFENNTAFRWPGIAVVDRAHLENCTFIGNVADRPDTCGVLCNALPTSQITAVNCVFENNQSYSVYNCYLPTPDFDVSNNWWGDPSGPYHAARNPQGSGDAICGDSLLFEPWLTEPPLAADDPHVPQLPTAFTLFNAFPNPFNPQTTIEFSMTRALPVRVEIFDLLGRKVTTLADGVREPGVHHVSWNASDQPSGIYFARLSSPVSRNTIQVKKLVLLK